MNAPNRRKQALDDFLTCCCDLTVGPQRGTRITDLHWALRRWWPDVSRDRVWTQNQLTRALIARLGRSARRRQGARPDRWYGIQIRSTQAWDFDIPRRLVDPEAITVAAFVAEVCWVGDNEWASARVLHAAYTAWAVEQTNPLALALHSLGARLRDLGSEPLQRKLPLGRGYRGLSLRRRVPSAPVPGDHSQEADVPATSG